MFAKVTIFALCAVLSSVGARVIMVQDSPITSEGMSLKISLKEVQDASGHPVASIRLYMDDGKTPPPPPPPRAMGEDDPMENTDSGDYVPSFEGRNAVKGNGRCALGTVWRGVKCVPVSG